jgi:hypothetical protein
MTDKLTLKDIDALKALAKKPAGKIKTTFVYVGTEEQVEETFRLRFLYKWPPSRIARKLKVSSDKMHELLIAATYWGLGFRDGRGKNH